MDDQAVFTYAHNIKIISQNGFVTLKGPVKSADEKKARCGKSGRYDRQRGQNTRLLAC